MRRGKNYRENHQHSPVAFRDLGDGRLEAVSVITFVTAVTQQQSVLILSAVTELAARLHDRLVPGYGGLQHIESHGKLGGVLGVLDGFAPTD